MLRVCATRCEARLGSLQQVLTKRKWGAQIHFKKARWHLLRVYLDILLGFEKIANIGLGGNFLGLVPDKLRGVGRRPRTIKCPSPCHRSHFGSHASICARSLNDEIYLEGV